MTTPTPPASPATGKGAAEPFPPRILALIQEAADREGIKDLDGNPLLGPMEDGNGEPLQDDADAALRWFSDNQARIAHLEARLREKEAESERLRALIDTPHTGDWVEASKLEAAHQIERWSASHDAGKQPEDWFWLLGYLGGKAVAAFRSGNKEKGLHHIVSSSAALLNWHRNVTGDSTTMRPGIDSSRGLGKGEEDHADQT